MYEKDDDPDTELHGKQVLIAVSLFIFLNAFLSEAKLEMKIEMSKKEGICGKYVQDPGHPDLGITHAFLTTKLPGTDNDHSSENVIGIIAVTNVHNREMVSQIEYRYDYNLVLNLFGAIQNTEAYKGSFKHDGHLHIKKIKLLQDGKELDVFGFDNSECIEDSYPDNMIADHGLYTLEKKGVAKWVRVYFEPQEGEHIVLN
ncbi:hypothetical protein CAEBREN_30573 [Caenorhabditis brenneri]|uniref:Uncharacterized protein n=1 Tax=Caenorhabditis brenneri TaxID=135651 RepID=G0NEW7_CAEBE|nr:hypothetical protein CAEBREN_30573 [Caenorhabditis brenneri]